MKYQQRERLASLFMHIITYIGWGIIFYQVYTMPPISSSLFIILLFGLFLGITEYYPIPVWKGFTTLNFPLVYIMLIIYNVQTAIIVYALAVFIINLLHKRPLRSVFFNPAQLAISIYISYKISLHLLSLDEIVFTSNIFIGSITYILFLLLFYIFSNTLVDTVLLLRPQPYTFAKWKYKTFIESISALFSIVYGILIYILGNQNRGVIDIFSYFFFFSPLIALSLIGTSIVRLSNEKNRLKNMFQLTRNLNTYMLNESGYPHSMNELKDFMNCDEVCLLIKEDEELIIVYPEYEVKQKINKELKETIIAIESIMVFENRGGPLELFFPKEMRSFVYVPLLLNEEMLGMIVLAKSRIKSFIEEDKNILATLANQLAAILKTRNLVKEQQEHHLIEERNRIARNFHDGIAQNLAAAILQLESSKKTLNKDITETKNYIDLCINNLRSSLWEVRNSIYALRPPKNHQFGLLPAIHKRLKELIEQSAIPIHFYLKGKPYPLSTMVERTIFDIFQESVQNSLKHSEAQQIDITLIYDAEKITLKVVDNGKGFSLFHEMIKLEYEPHFGILQMNEIAEQISASLDINSKLGIGTEITLTIPRLETKGVAYD